MRLNENIKYNIRLLMQDVKKLAREDKVSALEAYLKGINDSMEGVDKKCSHKSEKVKEFYGKGYDNGSSYSVFEKNSAKKTFNEEVDKLVKRLARKKKFTFF